MPTASAYLVQDVTYYSKSGMSEAFKAWRDGGPNRSGRFDDQGLVEAQTEHPHNPLRSGGQENQERGARLRHPGIRWQRVGPEWLTSNISRERVVSPVLQVRR